MSNYCFQMIFHLLIYWEYAINFQGLSNLFAVLEIYFMWSSCMFQQHNAPVPISWHGLLITSSLLFLGCISLLILNKVCCSAHMHWWARIQPLAWRLLSYLCLAVLVRFLIVKFSFFHLIAGCDCTLTWDSYAVFFFPGTPPSYQMPQENYPPMFFCIIGLIYTRVHLKCWTFLNRLTFQYAIYSN